MTPIELVLAIAVPLVALASVRVALPGERLVVVRGERIVRAAPRSVALIVPGLEQTRRWPLGAVEVPVLARTTTRDGVDVRALATCEIEVAPPVPGQSYRDPVLAARDLIESELVEAIAAREVHGLFDPALGLAAALAVVDLPHGRVLTVEVDAVDALLGPPGRCAG